MLVRGSGLDPASTGYRFVIGGMFQPGGRMHIHFHLGALFIKGICELGKILVADIVKILINL